MNAVNQHVVDMQTIQAWCFDVSKTIKDADFDGHMQLVSRKLKIYGLPKKDVLDFREWRARCKYEFENNSLLSVNFQDIRLVSSTARRLIFSANETMLGKDGKMVVLEKNFILELEEDNHWRVVEEKVINWRVKKLNLESF